MYFLNENYEAKLTWKYKIALQDPAVFDRISDIRGIKFPNELKSFIIKNNGATPSSYRFKVGKTERNFGAVLSFNQVKKGTDPKKQLFHFLLNNRYNYQKDQFQKVLNFYLQ